jgi:hypothetical protein
MVQSLGNRRATSIRMEELIRVLDDLAIHKAPALGEDAQKALIQALGKTRSPELVSRHARR